MKIYVHPTSQLNLVSNLHWQVLDPFGESFFGHKEIPNLIERGARFHARYKNGVEINIGITHEDVAEATAKSSKTVSFAALIATHKQFASRSCLVFMRAGDETDPEDGAVGLVCGLISGNVVLDEQFPLYELDAIHQRYVELCGKSGRIYAVHGDISPSEVEVVDKLSLNDLLAKKPKNSVLLTRLSNDKVILSVLISALSLIILLVGLALWDWYKDHVREGILAMQNQLSSPEHTYAEAVIAWLRKPVAILPNSIESIGVQVGHFPGYLAGWKLIHIACDENECSAKWRSSGGTYADFQKASPKTWGKLVLSQSQKDVLGDLQTISHSFKLNIPLGILPTQETWPNADEFAFLSGVDLQRLKDFKWALQIDAPQQQAIPVTLNPAAVSTHPKSIFAMPWSVNKQDWSNAKLILRLFKQNVTINRFELFIDEKDSSMTFSGSGLAYVKK
jgi:hypothetical protein